MMAWIVSLMWLWLLLSWSLLLMPPELESWFSWGVWLRDDGLWWAAGGVMAADDDDGGDGW